MPRRRGRLAGVTRASAWLLRTCNGNAYGQTNPTDRALRDRAPHRYGLRRESGRAGASGDGRDLHRHAPASREPTSRPSPSLAQGTSDLSVIVNSLTTVAAATPVTGITIGVGFGTDIGWDLRAASAELCRGPRTGALRSQRRLDRGLLRADLRLPTRERPAAHPTLTEAVTYSMTVKHF